jgi:hypothetical protein
MDTQGYGKQYELHFGQAERRDWSIKLDMVATFYFSTFENLLRLVTGLQPVQQQRSVTTPVKPSPPVAGPSARPVAVDQTPGLKEGKTVVDPTKPKRKGVIREVCANGRLRIEWDGKEPIRAATYAPEKVKVLPGLGAADGPRPDMAGQRVFIVGGRNMELHRRQGLVIRVEPTYSSVQLDGEVDVRRISTQYLQLLDEQRESTVLGKKDYAKIMVDEFAEKYPLFAKQRNVKLSGHISLENFLAAVGEAAKKEEAGAAEQAAAAVAAPRSKRAKIR